MKLYTSDAYTLCAIGMEIGSEINHKPIHVGILILNANRQN
jgi:hypothetical protein